MIPRSITRPISSVLRPATIGAHERGNGIRTVPLVTQSLGSTGFLNGITIFPPGTVLPRHFHNCDESVLVLSGRAIAEIDGQTYAMVQDEMSFIPVGVPHSFRNASDTEELKILWTYASIDASRTILATGQTQRVDAERGCRSTR